jgi:hypothetical protein
VPLAVYESACDRDHAGPGAGHIRRGYDSGEMIGYEIEGEDGGLFAAVASESELSPAAPR